MSDMPERATRSIEPTGGSDVAAVRDATDLLRLIGEHVALRAQGREHVGLCPFHDDRRPSLHVVTHKDHAFYKCFACGVSGDCFRFVMDFHHMEFGEALRFLADRAGITLQKRSRAAGESGPARDDLRRIAGTALDFFRRTFRDASAAREACERRGFTAETLDRFQVGAAPAGFDGLLSTVRGDADAMRAALAIGLLKERTDSAGGSTGAGCYDALRNRLVFPICDEVGRPIAFGGRTLDEADSPKYLNSPESPLFHKSRTLYGLHLAKRAIVEHGAAIVTEGYTDVIACHQAGFTNVVGTLGTALTREHAARLSRMCETVILVFDGDEAGRRAADRAVKIVFTEPVDVRICTLPDGVDPDDLLRESDGRERFAAAIAEAVDALSYKLRLVKESIPSRARQIDALAAYVADLGYSALPGVRRRVLFDSIAGALGIQLEEFDQAVRAVGRSQRVPAAGGAPDPSPLTAGIRAPEVSRARWLAEKEVLAVLLFSPDALAQLGAQALELDGAAFHDDAARAVAELMLPAIRMGAAPTTQKLLDHLRDDRARNLVTDLLREGERVCDDNEELAVGALIAAIDGLRSCAEREAHREEMASFRSNTAEAVPTISRSQEVLEQIRRRRERGVVPDAIRLGAR